MTTSDAALVRLDRGDRIATVTLDSPTNRNALSRRLVGELTQALVDAAQDDAVHAVVLTHTGSVFCSGAALDEALEHGMVQGAQEMLALFRAVLELPVPVVARVDGAVRAGGLGLLAACDVVVSGARSTFAFTEVRLGLAPAIISLPLRPLLDARAASRYYLTGETFDAATAEAMGLVTVSAEDVDAALARVLDGLRAASRQGLRETRRLTTRDRLRALDDDGPAMTELSARLFGSDEARSRFEAFLSRPKS